MKKKIEIKKVDKVDTLKKAKMWRHYEEEKKKKEKRKLCGMVDCHMLSLFLKKKNHDKISFELSCQNKYKMK